MTSLYTVPPKFLKEQSIFTIDSCTRSLQSFVPYPSFGSLQTPHHSVEYCSLHPQINSLEAHPKIFLAVLILHHFSGAMNSVDYSYPPLTLSFSNYSLNCHVIYIFIVLHLSNGLDHSFIFTFKLCQKLCKPLPKRNSQSCGKNTILPPLVTP